MEKLWSPWRSTYIESMNDSKTAKGCIFCNASSQDLSDAGSLLVSLGEHTLTILNLTLLMQAQQPRVQLHSAI